MSNLFVRGTVSVIPCCGKVPPYGGTSSPLMSISQDVINDVQCLRCCRCCLWGVTRSWKMAKSGVWGTVSGENSFNFGYLHSKIHVHMFTNLSAISLCDEPINHWPIAEQAPAVCRYGMYIMLISRQCVSPNCCDNDCCMMALCSVRRQRRMKLWCLLSESLVSVKQAGQ